MTAYLSHLVTLINHRMPYLRGSQKPRVYRGPIPLQAQVNALRRRVNANTRALVHEQGQVEIADTNTTTNYKLHTVDITALLTQGTKFRSNIIGDKFVNKWLKLRINTGPQDVKAMRVVVYSSLLADTIFSPTQANGSGIVTCPDPGAFFVFYDRFLQNESALNYQCENVWIPLRNIMTTYNGSNNTLERNPIRILFMWETTDPTNLQMGHLGYSHCVQDK